VRLWLLLAYLAMPIDLVPDVLPGVGDADDVVVIGAALRSVVRRAGPDIVARRWPGTPDGLAALWRLVKARGSGANPSKGPAGGPRA
jgi:uncharacterized membrane protein YkvA (DUF1232 family)